MTDLSTVIEEKDNEFLAQNIKGLMMTLLAHWNAQMDAARAETEFADIRPADIRLFAQLRGRTVKLAQIHREMGYSRQAAQQAVDRLVAQDMLRVEVAPGNRRDKLVSISERGQRWRQIAAHNIRQIEHQIAEALGEDQKEALRQNLAQLLLASERQK